MQAGEPVRAELDGMSGLSRSWRVSWMHVSIVSGRTPDRVAMATCCGARRWCRAVARSRSARVRRGRRPVPGAVRRGRSPRRLSRLGFRCWLCSVIIVAIREHHRWGGIECPPHGP